MTVGGGDGGAVDQVRSASISTGRMLVVKVSSTNFFLPYTHIEIVLEWGSLHLLDFFFYLSIIVNCCP